MKNFSKLTFSLILLVLIFTSCKKFEDVNKIASTAWNPNLAVPLAHAKFGVYDVLAKYDSTDLIIVNPNTGEIGLIYSSEIGSYTAEEIVDLGEIDQNFILNTIDLALPSIGSFNGTMSSNRTETFQIEPVGGVELKTVSFKSGILNVTLSTTLKHDMSATFTFPKLDSLGTPITRSILFTYTGVSPQTAEINIDLTNLNGDFTLDGTSFNQMEVNIATTVIGNGNEIQGNENFSMGLSTTELLFNNVTGYFGQQNVAQVADSVLLKVFQNASAGTFELSNPKIDFFIDNTFGFPVDIHLNDLKSINVTTGQETILTSSTTTINVLHPTAIGQPSVETNFELNSTNTTNLSEVISPTPKYFYYEIDAVANPNGNTGIDNFIEDDSRFTLRAEVNMPLEGLAYGFSIADTFDFEFNQNTDLIESITFRLVIDNGFPVQLGAQVHALDQNDNVIFSVFGTPETIASPAPVSTDGTVISSIQKITDINLNESQINQLNKVKKLIVYGEAATTDAQNGTYVKFFDFYKFDLKLAMQVQGSTSF
ncbi:MAG: hypothetical protein V4622_11890 [Bacteroidota bacterium]